MRFIIKRDRNCFGTVVPKCEQSVELSTEQVDTVAEMVAKINSRKHYGYRHKNKTSLDCLYVNGRKLCRHGSGASGGVHRPEDFLEGMPE
jgi:hypothetical protein